ncbi:MAG: hypothetical protein GWP06_04465 [Actinobacteria bacterium]|nr:hypothetical protein [Actinomycetota bacterium]
MKTVSFPHLKRLLFILIAIVLFGINVTFCFAQARLVHFPINSVQEGEALHLEAKLEGTQSLAIFVRIYYKTPGEDTYRYVDMRPEINTWSGAIPGNDIQGERLQYFISALTSDQNIITYPESNPYKEPEEVTIFPRKQPSPKKENEPKLDVFKPLASEQAPSAGKNKTKSPLILLSPEPNEILEPQDVLFAVSLSGNGLFADSNSVQIFLDGRKILRGQEISSFMISYQPKRMRLGKHSFKLVAKDPAGKPLEPVIVHFTVTGKKAKKSVTSNFQAHVFSDLRQEVINRRNESFTMTGGDFSGQYGVIRYSGRAFFTSLEDKHFQPRNRFQFNLRTKWLGISGGDTHPRFNDLILWGKRVRGMSGYIHLGFFNIDAVYGTTYRGVEGSATTVTDASRNTSIQINRFGTFAQNLVGIRPSIGSGKHFQLGLTLVKIKDDTTSIKYGAMPKDNVVFGPDLKIAFDGGRFTILAAGAFSLLTNNIYNGPLSTQDLEDVFGQGDIPIDPADYEKYLIINDSTVPIDPTKLTSMAYNVRMRFSYFRNILQVGYKSIGAEYNSLANSWIRNDIQGFFFSDRLRMLSNKIYLNLGYEDYLDNFSDYSANPSVNLKTLNYGVSIYPGQNWPRINVTMRNHYRDNGIDQIQTEDLLYSGEVVTRDNREKILNKDFSVQMGYDVNLFNLRHNFFISYMTSERVDDYNSTRLSGLPSQEFSSNIRMFTWSTRYSFPLKTTISYATNDNLAAGGDSDYKYNMLGAGGEYTLFNGKITTFADFRMTSAQGNTISGDNIDFNRNHFRFGGAFYIGPRHSVSLDANFLTYKNNAGAAGTTNSSYTDQIIRLRYEKFF